MTPHELVNDAVSDSVLLFGSLPPQARDLDLLVRPPQEAELREMLRREGFHEHGGEWVRFRDCTAEALDLVPASDWGLSDEAIGALFAEALPIEGLRNVVRPAPHHLLLIIAQRVAEVREGLSDKRRTRIAAALGEAPTAWEEARRQAQAWAAVEALAELERHCASPPEPPRRPERRPPQLVAFAGVDGAGKTSQIEGLEQALAQVGLRTAQEYVRIEWMTLTGNPALSAIAAPVKAILRLFERTDATAGEERDRDAEDVGRRLRERSRVISYPWALIVAAAHTGVQRRAARRGDVDVVICDRYTLDARVYLRYRYGHGRRMRLQTSLVEKLSPKPMRTYYLAIPPERALARKTEQYGVAELTELVRLYEEEYPRAGARRLDAERPREQICAEIALDVWRALRGAP